MAKKAVNVEVSLKEVGGDINRLIRRFMKKVKKERIIEDYLEGTTYVKPSEKRRLKKAKRKQAAQRAQKTRGRS